MSSPKKLGDRQIGKMIARACRDNSTLRTIDYAVACALFDFASTRTNQTTVSTRTLADETPIARSSISKSIDNLVAAGVIEKRGEGRHSRIDFSSFIGRELVRDEDQSKTGTGPQDGPPLVRDAARLVRQAAESVRVADPKEVRKDVLRNQGKDRARARTDPRPIKNRQPEFDELLATCIDAGVRGSDRNGIMNAVENVYGFTPTDRQCQSLERQIIDRRRE